MRCAACLLLALASLGVAAPVGAGDPDPPVAERARPEVPGTAVEVRRVHLPVTIEPRTRKARRLRRCAPPPTNDLIVTEDESPLRITAIDRGTVDVLHVILVDTSSSMRKRIEQTKQTANRYLGSLPEGEPAMVASFDDSLVLHSAPQIDRSVLTRAVNGLVVGHNTALWTSLDYLIRYLDPLPAHKVVILLSDGEDSSSMPGHSVGRLVELITGMQDLTLFAIGLDLPADLRGGPESPVSQLRALARGTGGSLFEIRSVDELDGVFGRIRHRLEHKYYVSYVPKPFGKGPRDEPDRFDSRLRVVDVRPKDRVPCRVEALAQTTRLERRATVAVAPLDEPVPLAPPAISDERVLACLGRADSLSVDRALPVDSPYAADGDEDDGSAGALYHLRGTELWAGRLIDVAADPGVVYNRILFRDTGVLRLGLQAVPELATREVLLEIPPLDTVRETLRSPEDVILHLLRRPACAALPDEPGRVDDPRWVNGSTLLDVRQALGQAVLDSTPAYRRWAAERIRELGWQQFRGLLAEYRRAGRSADAERAELRRIVEAQASNPPPELPQLFLAEWLSDVPARELALRLQALAADRLLRSVGGDPADAESARLVQQGWDLLRAWLPPPTRVRVVAPLLPAYDPDRDVFGFHRIVLPRPLDSGSRASLVPPAPRGLLLVRWMIRAVPDGWIDDSIRVLGVEERDVPDRESPAVGASATGRESAVEVRLHLAAAPASGAGRFGMLARFAPGAESPQCLDLVEVGAPGSAARLRLAAFERRVRSAGVGACTPTRGVDAAADDSGPTPLPPAGRGAPGAHAGHPDERPTAEPSGG